jgi:hypothetical protein
MDKQIMAVDIQQNVLATRARGSTMIEQPDNNQA